MRTLLGTALVLAVSAGVWFTFVSEKSEQAAKYKPPAITVTKMARRIMPPD